MTVAIARGESGQEIPADELSGGGGAVVVARRLVGKMGEVGSLGRFLSPLIFLGQCGAPVPSPTFRVDVLPGGEYWRLGIG